jgi:N-methylhydantoinase A/oxoprolinase/acetone carboxylase beta subunit
MAVRLGIDTGETFTDPIPIDDVTGELDVAKSPSMPFRRVDAIMNVIPLRGIMTEALEAIGVGMNVATNAVLQWNETTVIYVTTAGGG